MKKISFLKVKRILDVPVDHIAKLDGVPVEEIDYIEVAKGKITIYKKDGSTKPTD